MVEKYEAYLRACKTREHLFTLAFEIIEEFAGEDECLKHFAQLCIEQLELIETSEMAKA